mgnify:CR=1 FL=1|jgi:RIO-like serine/threonine protein kinase
MLPLPNSPEAAEALEAFQSDSLLKADCFGQVEQGYSIGEKGRYPCARRDLRSASWWARPVARLLARREARALRVWALTCTGGKRWQTSVCRLIAQNKDQLLRAWVEGKPMQVAQPNQPEYFAQAFRLLCQLHRAGIAHNDLAKEPNWLVLPDGSPGLIDFQLASVFRKRTRLFRMMAREDIRHLLKHKRTYCADSLTDREKQVLQTPSFLARFWRVTGKRVYWFITRKILRWADREGAGNRG